MKKQIVLIFYILVAADCSDLNFGEVKSAELKFQQGNRQGLVMFMSLETMFPDQNVRALAKAAGKGQIKKIEKLVSQGIDVNARGASNATPLIWAMRDINGFKKLLELGANPNVIFGDGGNVMRWAAEREDESFLVAALERGGNPNIVAGQFERTPLFAAIGKNTFGVLLDAGADINARDSYGSTVLLTAAGRLRYDIVYDLLLRGADYNIKNNFGKELVDRIASDGPRMNPKGKMTPWLEKVVIWLEARRLAEE